MPNRIIKESICRSEEIDSLSWFEEVLFYRLIVTCDDFGRYDGRAKIIKGSCFPLKDITEKDIDKALGRLSAVGLVRVYEAQGRPYLQLVTWADHQRIRNQKSKYPGFSEDCELLTFDSKGQQIKTSDNKCVRNPIQSESKSESETNTNICSEQTVAAEPPVIGIMMNTGEEYPITQSYVLELAELYPAVDIMQELRAMKGWCDANPRKRKTAGGMKRFINAWISKVQNRGGTPGYAQSYNQATGGSKVEQFARRKYKRELYESLGNHKNFSEWSVDIHITVSGNDIWWNRR